MPERTATLSSTGLLALCLAMAASTPASAAQAPATLPALVPRAASVQAMPGRLVLANNAHFVARDAQAKQVLAQLSRLAGDAVPAASLTPPTYSFVDGAIIELKIVPGLDVPAEGYRLRINPTGASLQAANAHGLFHGAITLWQLLTASMPKQALRVAVPALRIDDAPRFAWRGLMLDSARHFQSVDEIKQPARRDGPAQARHVFHWHLTDDQGWRFEVPGWPKLTEVGGCRDSPPATAASTRRPARRCRTAASTPRRRSATWWRMPPRATSTVVPEVDMPGHATAAIAAYPQLGVSGQPIAVSNEWGVNVNLFNADETTLRFLEDVLGELVKLFPGAATCTSVATRRSRTSGRPRRRCRRGSANWASPDEAGLQAWMVGAPGCLPVDPRPRPARLGRDPRRRHCRRRRR
jgi:hexosaminidase